MGTYTYGEYLDTFGGVPDPGEYAPDFRELADRRRDERDEQRETGRGPRCGDCGERLHAHPYAQHADGRHALDCPNCGPRDSLNTIRDEATAFLWRMAGDPVPPSRPLPPCGGTCGPEGCMARGCPVGQDVDREDTYTASEAAADAAIDRDYFEAHEHDDIDLLRDECEPFEDDDEEGGR